MGLLNFLFENKKGVAKKLAMDSQRRMTLWKEHLSNYASRESLSKHFNYKNVDNALQDFEHTKKILDEIESLISPEIVTIAHEEKTDDDILAELERLKNNGEIELLSKTVVSEKQKQSLLREFFDEILKVLKAELHLIQLLRKKPENARDLLLKLFVIIFHQEARLYKIFEERYFHEGIMHSHQHIMKISRAIILEEKIEEEMETDAEKFVKEVVNHMAQTESNRSYRKLGEDIFLNLAEMAGAPMPRWEDITEGIERMEKLMENDKTMYKIVKKLRPRYDDIKIRGVISAFRETYVLGHFEELESEFST